MPTAAEADILAVLWRLGPATVREVHDALEKECGYNTTLTQMRLMTDKGLLVGAQPTTSEERAEIRRMLDELDGKKRRVK